MLTLRPAVETISLENDVDVDSTRHDSSSSERHRIAPQDANRPTLCRFQPHIDFFAPFAVCVQVATAGGGRGGWSDAGIKHTSKQTYLVGFEKKTAATRARPPFGRGWATFLQTVIFLKTLKAKRKRTSNNTSATPFLPPQNASPPAYPLIRAPPPLPRPSSLRSA